MIEIKKIKKDNSFLSDLLTTLSGLSVAQIVPLIASPVLSRIFVPDQFGVFAVFWGVSSILSILFCLRLDTAIVVTSSIKEVNSIFVLGIILSIVLSIVTIFLLKFAILVIGISKINIISDYLFFVGIISVMICFYQFGVSYLLRFKQFKTIAKLRAYRALLIVILTILLEISTFVENGLIMGIVIGQLIVTIGTVLEVFKITSYSKLIECYDFSSLKSSLLRNQKFPLYSTPAGVFNSLAAYLPVFLLSGYVNLSVAGYYGFIQRAVGVPVGVISGGLGELYKQKISLLYAQNRLESYIFLIKNLKRTFLLFLPIFTISFFFIDILFPFIFGQQWISAIPILKTLFPVFFLMIIASPVSVVLYIVSKQEIELLINSIYLFLGVIALSIGIFLIDDWMVGVIFYAMSTGFVYLLTITYSTGLLKKSVKN